MAKKKSKFGKIQRKNTRPSIDLASNGKVKITLMSDLCVGAGESYQSKVDQEVVYDDYGFPYIPAKRLRGCIRESALELAEFDDSLMGSYESLFGKEGSLASKFILNDAHLEDYEGMVKGLQSCSNQSLKHPQNVLELYTYTRTQTKIDSSTGIAQDNSLRTMRVVRKGLTFIAEVKFKDKKISKGEIDLLNNAISMTKHIGLNRTRGLGLVDMDFVQNQDKNQEESYVESEDLCKSKKACSKFKISYSLYLNSNVLCKSVEGNQTRTQDYIEGGKILGLLAERLSGKKYKNLVSKSDIIASNAYIACENERCVPVKASYQKIKDQKFNEQGQMQIKDMLYLDPKVDQKDFKDQLTPVSYAWMTSNHHIQDVETEIRYHHSRPEDKSIGHAKGNGEGEFYQMNSLKAGQVFKGYILVNDEQKQDISRVLCKERNLRMGYGKGSEYGDVIIQNVTIEDVEKPKEECVNEFELKLNAPLILYNDYLMPIADVKDLEKLLNEILGCELTLKKSFLKYETIGGFNVSWQRKKQSMIVLGKGTVCTFTSEQPVDISKLKNAFIGERNSEGYGEITVSTEKEKHPYLYKSSDKEVKSIELSTKIIGELKYQKNRREWIQEARNKAQARKVKVASLSKFRIIFSEQASLEGMKEQIDGICKQGKNADCKAMYEDVYGICQKDLDHYDIYVREYINSLKYQLKEDESYEE